MRPDRAGLARAPAITALRAGRDPLTTAGEYEQIYGSLIGSGTDRTGLTIGYLIGGGIMIIGGLGEVFLGINAEGKSLETVARPLTEVGSGGSTS